MLGYFGSRVTNADVLPAVLGNFFPYLYKLVSVGRRNERAHYMRSEAQPTLGEPSCVGGGV